MYFGLDRLKILCINSQSTLFKFDVFVIFSSTGILCVCGRMHVELCVPMQSICLMILVSSVRFLLHNKLEYILAFKEFHMRLYKAKLDNVFHDTLYVSSLPIANMSSKQREIH